MTLRSLSQFAIATAACCTLAIVWTTHLATAQDPAGGRGTALGVRQQRVERMVEEIERKFKALAQAIKETEPERAERLIEALKESRELQLNGRMGEIVKLLDQSQLDGALNDQQQALVDIRKLLSLLLNEQNDREKALEESQRLEKFRQQIESILQDQIRQKMEADRTANKEKTLADLEAQIKAVEELIQKQKAVNDDTQAARGGATSKLGPVTEKQRQVKDETQKAADAIAGEETKDTSADDKGDPDQPESKSGKAAGGEPKENSGKKGSPKEGDKSGDKPEGDKPENDQPEGDKPADEPKEATPGDDSGKKSEGKSGGKNAGGKNTEGKKSEGKKGGSPSEGESPEGGESPSGESSDDEGKEDGGEKKPPRAKPQLPAEQALRSAKENQQKAENQLNRGKPRAAGQDQEKALEDLQKALSELKNDRDRIASLPPEAFKKMAEKQNDTADQTKQLHAEMKQGKPSDGKQDDQSGGKPSAGSDSVAKAQQQMQQAAGDLDTQDPDSASRKQAKAIKDLEKALEEIEERLAQLREETQLEKLARLEARFKEMLARQKEASKQTIDLEARRDSNGELSRVDKLALGKVAAEEQSLAEAAQQAYDIIFEDGTSVVFPEIVGQLREDLQSVGKMLANQKSDSYTQSQQREIEISLEELIEALKKAQSQKESQGGGGGGGGGGEQPLLPSSAELKLLRFSQLRINRRTEAFDKARPAGELGDGHREEMQNISKRQQDVGDMTLRILERQQEK